MQCTEGPGRRYPVRWTVVPKNRLVTNGGKHHAPHASLRAALGAPQRSPRPGLACLCARLCLPRAEQAGEGGGEQALGAIGPPTRDCVVPASVVDRPPQIPRPRHLRAPQGLSRGVEHCTGVGVGGRRTVKVNVPRAPGASLQPLRDVGYTCSAKQGVWALN